MIGLRKTQLLHYPVQSQKVESRESKVADMTSTSEVADGPRAQDKKVQKYNEHKRNKNRSTTTDTSRTILQQNNTKIKQTTYNTEIEEQETRVIL